MASHRAPGALPKQSRFAWVLTIAAFLLGLLALVVVFEDWVGGRGMTATWTTWLNLITGLTGVSGATGYGFGKRWGLYAFGVSVLGHIAAHTALILGAIAHHRVTIFSIGGLSVIPVIAICILIGMVWQLQSSSVRARASLGSAGR
jgi:hypothetical protein